ncbi:MAG: FAD/NAD(P)-binding oxidoreductase [Alphaproteobacteria bacterium]
MAHVVVLGAGLGGVIMAYEMREQLSKGDKLTVITKEPKYHFVPSNPWVAVNWRKRGDLEIDLTRTFTKRNIDFVPVAAQRVHPAENRIELVDGNSVDYDFLIIATGPELAFDEIEGLGPHSGYTQSVCHVDHAEKAGEAFEEFCKDPKPIIVGAVQGASCFGPAYEFCFILDTALRRKKIRDKVPMTFVTSEPYVGHLGLDGVGDTKGLLESEMREHHIKWINNSKVQKVEPGKMFIEEMGEDGNPKANHELPFGYAMMLPAFRGIEAIRGVEGLVNPRGFVLIDKYQRNPSFSNVYSVGVCVAIPPTGPTPVPCGVPKTGFMIESMVTATALNIGQVLRGGEPTHEATWNAVCLADFGDSGVALAKIAFESYFIRKMRRGESEPFYEKAAMSMLGIDKLKRVT